MLSHNELWVMIFGVLVSLGFVIFSMYVASKLFKDQVQDVLVKFILMVFASLVGVFIVDKVVDFKVKLLSEELNGQLFELIKTLILMIFSYYFGTQKSGGTNSGNKECE